MSKKKKVIAIAVAAIVVVIATCIALLNQGNVSQEASYDKELYDELKNLGKTNLSEITNFKDGLYVVDNEISVVNPQFKDFEKTGNSLNIGENNSGNRSYICGVEEETKYEKATTYKLYCISLQGNSDVITASSINDIAEMVKNNQIGRDNLDIQTDKYKIKVTSDGTVLLNDIKMRTYKIEKKTEEEKKAQTEEIEKAREQYMKEAEELNRVDIPESADTQSEEVDTVE